ncbi:APC family permease [Streptomyces kanamyceticus]|uniref:APC family permease n=1 Tax=Streptomyces kanamyceticus TaxID=1967 RepID=UPI001F0B4B82|nr:APC family permease [Streptomyces kanamyceticus]
MNSAPHLLNEDRPEYERILDEALRTAPDHPELAAVGQRLNTEQLRTMALNATALITAAAATEYAHYVKVREELREPRPSSTSIREGSGQTAAESGSGGVSLATTMGEVAEPAAAGAGAIAVVAVLAWLKIDLNARVLGVLLLVEVALVVIFDIAAVADPAKEGLSLHAFNPDTLSGAGVATSLCFCIAAFTGFEQAPVYAEETSRPQVVVARVMFFAVGFVAVFFAFSSWALTVAAGPSGIVPAAQEQSAGLLFNLTESRLGGTFTDVLHVLFVTGMFAAILSFHNVVARYAFAMGRERLLPAAFGRTNTSTGAPGTGSLLQTVVSVVVVIGFAVADDGPAGDPTAPVLHLFTWGGNIGALGVILLMATASIAVIVFFVRRGAARAQVWRITASALATVGLLVIAGYTVKDFDVLVGAGKDSALSWVLPGVIFLAAVIGVVYGAVLRARNPAAHARIGLGNEAFQLEKASGSAEM